MSELPLCPCGSGESYQTCCEPRHLGSRPAETAEALMRSRYAAFARGRGEYVLATQASGVSKESADAISRWSRSVAWLGLTVLRTERGGESDARGTVEFEARYREGEEVVVQREVSRFDRVEGRWRYLGGKAGRRKATSSGQRR